MEYEISVLVRKNYTCLWKETVSSLAMLLGGQHHLKQVDHTYMT